MIKFTSRPNRSTTAAPYGQSIRAVNGLADGVYVARMVNVDCEGS